MIRISVPMFNGAIFDAYERGIIKGRYDVEQRVSESTHALLEENNRLKGELSRQDTRLMAKAQTDSFPAVHKEQLRIVKTIRKVLPKKAASSLLFKLAMGDIGDLK